MQIGNDDLVLRGIDRFNFSGTCLKRAADDLFGSKRRAVGAFIAEGSHHIARFYLGQSALLCLAIFDRIGCVSQILHIFFWRNDNGCAAYETALFDGDLICLRIYGRDLSGNAARFPLLGFFGVLLRDLGFCH